MSQTELPDMYNHSKEKRAWGGLQLCDLYYARAGPREAAGRKCRSVSKRLNCCAAAAELGAHGKPTAAKISPRTSTALIRQPYIWSAVRKAADNGA